MAKTSKTVKAGSRIFYFDRRKTKAGKLYFTVTEMALASGKRYGIVVFPENAEAFARAFCEMADINVSKS